jgi:hypothetical protein
MNALADCLTVHALRQTLDGLSADLEETYSEACDRMKRPLSQPRQQVLQQLLLWVSWVYRPLSISELEHALATKPGCSSINAETILPIAEIVTWSAGLLLIDRMNYVHFIHPTAARFFWHHRTSRFPNGDNIIA